MEGTRLAPSWLTCFRNVSETNFHSSTETEKIQYQSYVWAHTHAHAGVLPYFDFFLLSTTIKKTSKPECSQYRHLIKKYID